MIPAVQRAALMAEIAGASLEAASAVLMDGDIDATGPETRDLRAAVISAWEAARLLHDECEALLAARWSVER